MQCLHLLQTVVLLLGVSQIFAGPVVTSDFDQLTSAQIDTINKYKVGNYYTPELKIIDVSKPKGIPCISFVNRMRELDSLLLLIKNGDSSVISNDFSLVILYFFPQDPPLTWVYKGSTEVQGGIIGIRSVDEYGNETFRDSTPPPYTRYYVKDKFMNGMAPLSISMPNKDIINRWLYIRFYNRSYYYVIIALGNDTYIMLKTILLE